jgi:hypothetical protein
MGHKFKTALRFIATGLWLLIMSVLLTLAVNQARRLISLYTASVALASTIGASNLMRPSTRFSNDILILISVAAVLAILVFKRPDRLGPVSISAALVFVALNLYSGRHLLPQLLIWPSPPALSEQYMQALSANDIEAALRLTDRSEACRTVTAAIFQQHRARLAQQLGENRPAANLRDISVKRLATFYDQPLPQGRVIMQPVPQQLLTLTAKTKTGSSIWLNLKLSYRPLFGTRYICGGGPN